MKQRIFIGIFLSEKLQKNIVHWQKKHHNLPVRFIKPENLHLTLIPPWYEKNMNKVKNLLSSWKREMKPRTGWCGVKPFSVCFEEVAFGPTYHNPRLIWATGNAPPEFKKLKSNLAKLLKQKKEKRDLLLHLTTARFKKEDFKKILAKTLSKKSEICSRDPLWSPTSPILIEKINWQEKIKSFSLIKSHLEKTGARYEKIE